MPHGCRHDPGLRAGAGRVKAWQVNEFGEPADVLRWVDRTLGDPAAGQVRIRVTAAGLGLPDVLMCPGHLPADTAAAAHPRPGAGQHRHRGPAGRRLRGRHPGAGHQRLPRRPRIPRHRGASACRRHLRDAARPGRRRRGGILDPQQDRVDRAGRPRRPHRRPTPERCTPRSSSSATTDGPNSADRWVPTTSSSPTATPPPAAHRLPRRCARRPTGRAGRDLRSRRFRQRCVAHPRRPGDSADQHHAAPSGPRSVRRCRSRTFPPREGLGVRRVLGKIVAEIDG